MSSPFRAVLIATCALSATLLHAQTRLPPRWIATWSPSQSAAGTRPPAGTPDRVPTYASTTIRQIVRTTIGGDHVRLRFSNEYGDKPIVISNVHVALRASGADIKPESDKPILFGGDARITIRTGATVTSDDIAFPVPALGDLVISLYLPDSARTNTRHALGVATTYIARTGDKSASATFTADTTMHSWIFLTGVDVTNPKATGAIVTIGNSITDGYASTVDANHRWPDILAERLLASKEPMKSVINAGISGNRVLTFGAGPSAVARFDRDVAMIPGVTHVIVLEGINDLSRTTGDEVVTGPEIMYGLKQMADRAHELGLVVYGATLCPYGGTRGYTAEAEAKRQAVNTWIRTSEVFDGVIDFDLVTRDPAKPSQFNGAYDSGDHLHPNDTGYQAMAEAIGLEIFKKRPLRPRG